MLSSTPLSIKDPSGDLAVGLLGLQIKIIFSPQAYKDSSIPTQRPDSQLRSGSDVPGPMSTAVKERVTSDYYTFDTGDRLHAIQSLPSKLEFP